MGGQTKENVFFSFWPFGSCLVPFFVQHWPYRTKKQIKQEVLLIFRVLYRASHCWGPGSGIRCFCAFDPGIRDGESGFGIRDEHPGSYFRELRNNFAADPDPGSFRPWILDGKFGSGIRYKHSGSPTLVLANYRYFTISESALLVESTFKQ